MQSPIYEQRLALLATFKVTAVDPVSRLAVHGMRDVTNIIAGMISQLAISFTILG